MSKLLNPTEHHIRRHRLKDGTLPPMRKCMRCIVARQKCEDKINYKSRDLADKAALDINIERHWFPGSCLLAYRCRYAPKNAPHWHLTTATRKDQNRRVDSMRRKWLRKTHQKDDSPEDNDNWELPEAG